ncbi:MAG TPA: hypothetical protein VE570_06165 [Thermoleophilaceae bacterium]|jgi:hypothetical protein|nr:hypothetical protein [Thermoleophilaceae bacterium]
MDQKQRDRFREAVEKKNEEALRRRHEQAAAASARAHEEQLIDADESPDTPSPREKSTGHGKKTADKWNQ